MLKRPRTDFWRVGIVPAPIEELDAARLAALKDRVVWLPEAGPWRYYADPFGLIPGRTRTCNEAKRHHQQAFGQFQHSPRQAQCEHTP